LFPNAPLDRCNRVHLRPSSEHNNCQCSLQSRPSSPEHGPHHHHIMQCSPRAWPEAAVLRTCMDEAACRRSSDWILQPSNVVSDAHEAASRTRGESRRIGEGGELASSHEACRWGSKTVPNWEMSRGRRRVYSSKARVDRGDCEAKKKLARSSTSTSILDSCASLNVVHKDFLIYVHKPCAPIYPPRSKPLYHYSTVPHGVGGSLG
jgi:hypothetical protein